MATTTTSPAKAPKRKPAAPRRAAGRIGRRLSEPDPFDKFWDGPSFDALSDDEKAKVAAYYDRGPIPYSETRPMTKAERARWERARRKKPGRPKVGNGVKVVSLSVERGLLDRADAYAQRHGLTRARLVAMGLESVLRADRSAGRSAKGRRAAAGPR